MGGAATTYILPSEQERERERKKEESRNYSSERRGKAPFFREHRCLRILFFPFRKQLIRKLCHCDLHMPGFIRCYHVRTIKFWLQFSYFAPRNDSSHFLFHLTSLISPFASGSECILLVLVSFFLLPLSESC